MKRIYIIVLFCLYACTAANAQNFAVRTVKDSLFIPWEIIFGPDSNIWFTQKNGYICRLDPANGNTDTLYHETNTVIQGEGGMLGMALHPSFPTQPYVYVAYEYSSGGYKERVVRYTYSGNTLGSPLILLDNITGGNIHNGCRLLITNNKLFISTGDAGTASNAQDLNSINGKMLRINLDGSIPSDNPITGSPIWNWGQRNIQGIVAANGMMYTSMHGLNTDDEVNILTSGGNYGWPNVEGYCDQSGEMTFCADSNVIEPIYAWTPTIAPAGIDFYDHQMFPQWQNSLAMTTLKDTSLYILKLNTAHDAIIAAIRIDTLKLGRIRDICISPVGSIFLSTSNSAAGGTGAKTDKIVEIYDSTFVPLSVSIKASTNTLSIYPNPAQDNITVSMKGRPVKGMNYVITNAIGQAVNAGTLGSNTISLKSLPAGFYQLKVSAIKGEVYTGKILKE